MKQFIVIGIGNFGYFLASNLYDKGHDVMAIDKNPELVEHIKTKVTRAVVADATDASVIESLGVKEMDVAVVSIGSILSNSILAVLNLQEAGIGHIVAKAINEPHKRVLEKLGVKDICFPEKDNAISMAERLHNPNLIDYLPFLEGYGIIELPAPKKFIGKSLRQVNLPSQYDIQIVAIKTKSPEKIHFIPKADYVFKKDDIMILLGSENGFKKLKTK